MSMQEQSPNIVERQQVTTEVLELGQALFDELIVFAETCPASEDGSEAFPVEDVRTATDEFFRALRVLLNVDQSTAP